MTAVGQRVALCVRANGGEDAMLLVPSESRLVHLGVWHALPEATVEDDDARVPCERLAEPASVAALRGLFLATGILHADHAEALDSNARAALLDSYRASAREGHAHFRALGLRWRNRRVVSLFDVEGGGDLRREDVDVHELCLEGHVRPRPQPGAWHALRDLWSDFGAGRLVLPPELPRLLRRALHIERGLSLEAPGLAEIAPGISMLPLKTPTLPPAEHTNVFLVGTGECVLVEPASPYAREVASVVRLVEAQIESGMSPQAILATHHHPDHIGGARALSEKLGLPLWAHRLTAERLRGVVEFERLLDDGERIELDGPEPLELECIHTPGHAPGHLCFVDRRSSVMIAGDMIAGVGSILVEPYDGDMALYLASLGAMAAREPSRLLPAHGGIIANPQGCLEGYIEHRNQRERKVLDALARIERPATASELVPLAYQDAPKSVWPLAARAAEAHLLKLVAEGRATKHPRGAYSAA